MIMDKRQALALSAVLAATVLTGAAWMCGDGVCAMPRIAAPIAIVQPAQPAAQSFGEAE